MKIFYIILILLSVSPNFYAQHKQGFEINTIGGYEYNYFKSPDQLIQNGVLLNQNTLISSSIYQDIAMDYDFRYKWGENRIRFSIAPEARLFYENFTDSYWSLIASSKYDYNLTSSVELVADISFKRMNRKGLDGDQDVLINPLGYYSVGGSAGMQLKPWNNNKTLLEGFYNFKNFDAYGTRDLSYNEYGIQFKTQQNFDSKGLKHKFGLSGYAKKRLYKTFNASDTNPNGTRDWNYIFGNLYYTLPISENFEIEPNFEYMLRLDVGANKSGFAQYGPVLQMKFDNNKTKLNSSVEYLIREYSAINARDDNGEIGMFTTYQYLGFRLKFEHVLSKNFLLTAELYNRIRNTNYTDLEARSFRGYRHQYAGIGLSYEF